MKLSNKAIAVLSVAGIAILALAAPWGLRRLGIVQLPVTCKAGESLSLRRMKYDGPGPAVITEAGCQLYLEDTTLRADVVLQSHGPLQLEAKRTIFIGKVTAFELAPGATLDFLSSRASSAKTVVKAAEGFELNLENSFLDGNDSAIEAGANARISARSKSIIASKGVALNLGEGSSIELLGSTLRGQKKALEGGSKAVLTAASSEVFGSVELAGDSQATFSKRTKLTEARDGLVLGPRSRVKLDDSAVETSETGILAKEEVSVALEPKSFVFGVDVGIEAGPELSLTMRSATLGSDGVALKTGPGLKLDAQGGELRGTSASMALSGPAASLSLAQDVKVIGPQQLGEADAGVALPQPDAGLR